MMGKLGKWIVALFLILLALAVVFPVWFTVTGAFSAQWELAEDLSPVLGGGEGMASWSLLPKAPTLRSLVEILLDSPQFFTMFWNSVAIALGTLAGQLLFGVPAAWGLARYAFPGQKGILTGYIVLMLMPFQVLMFPQYLVLSRLELLDTLWAVILPAVFSTFPVFILYRFFRGIPEELLEAARIDGAGEWRIFLEIGLPLGKSGILSAAVLSFLEAWNLIEQPMTFLKTRALWPLSLFLPETTLSDAGVGFAASLMMLVPALLVFLACQDSLEQGIAAAGLKE